jgi:RTX calcium-binding nonapeptide repeat (4 copies)
MRKALVALLVGGMATLGLVATASAAPFTGLVSPTVQGGLADLNGTGTITTADSWVDFYGDTDVISGGLDCDAWGNVENDGSDGDNVITNADDCILIGVDGSADGTTIIVSNGSFSTQDGVAIINGTKLPTVFNATSPTNTSVAAADFAWQAINGRVDANGNNVIDDGDCSVGIVNGWDILGVDCGFAPPTPSADNGKIDVNGDHVITVADDSVAVGGFFGLAVEDGLVQATAAVGAPTITSFTPAEGAVGSTVLINGTNLGGATVKFGGGVTASCTANSTGTQLTCIVPVGAVSGKITVTTTAGTATSATNFTVPGTPNPNPNGCTIVGDGGANTLIGTSGPDTICGKAGPDLLKGKAGDDLLKGGKGQDTLKGGKGFDTCKGGKGKDTLIGCEA